MEEFHSHAYKGHLIMAYSRPAPGDMFYGTFRISRTDPAAPAATATTIHRQDESENHLFRSSGDAIRESLKRAEAWIDTQSH